MSTMPCKCKICKNNHTELVNRLAQENTSLKAIQTQLLTLDLDISETTIQRHLKAFNLMPGWVDREPEIIEKSPVLEAVPVHNYSIRDISLSKWGLSMDDPHGIVRYLQECHVKLYCVQLDIYVQELLEYANGERELYPNTALSALNKLFALLDPVTALSIYANQQAAMKTIQGMGIELPKLSGYVSTSSYTEAIQ